MDKALKNVLNYSVKRSSKQLFTKSLNVDFFRGTQGRGGRNVSSVTGGRRGGGRGGDRFGYGRGRCGRGGRGGLGGRGSRGGVRGGRGNYNSYNNNRRQNHNHLVYILDLTRNFTPE